MGAFSFRRTDFSCGFDGGGFHCKRRWGEKGDVIKDQRQEVSCASAQAPRDIFQTGIEGDLIIKVERDGKPVELCIQKKELLIPAKKLGIL